MFDEYLKGSASESLVVADLLMQGVEVFTPVALGGNYDLVAILDGELFTIQVKSGTPQDNYRLKADVRRSSNSKTGREYKKDYDILAVVDVDNRKVAYIPKDKMTAKASITIYTERDFSRKGLHKDYEPMIFEDYLDFPIR